MTRYPRDLILLLKRSPRPPCYYFCKKYVRFTSNFSNTKTTLYHLQWLKQWEWHPSYNAHLGFISHVNTSILFIVMWMKLLRWRNSAYVEFSMCARVYEMKAYKAGAWILDTTCG